MCALFLNRNLNSVPCRHEQVASHNEASRPQSPHKKVKKKKRKEKSARPQPVSSDDEKERKKFKRSISLQEEERKVIPPPFHRSTSSFLPNKPLPFRIPKIHKNKPESPT